MKTRFYKDTANGLWWINNTVFPPRSMSMTIISEDEVRINTLASATVNQTSNPIFKGKVSDIVKSNGTPYSNSSELITATADFFK